MFLWLLTFYQTGPNGLFYFVSSVQFNFTIGKKLFIKNSDNTAKNSGSMMMNRYFVYLPRKFHISSQQTSTGFIIDVENFDKWLGNDTLMAKYQNSDAARPQQQQDVQIQVANVLKQVSESNKEIVQKLHEDDKPKKKHHWFKGLFHK